MSDEITNKPTGERGVFKLDKPEEERTAKNIEVKEAPRGVIWVYDHDLKKVVQREKKGRPVVNAPAVIPDEIPPTEFMGNANREMYTSRRALERRTQEATDEINKKWALKPNKPTREEIIEEFQRESNAVK